MGERKVGVKALLAISALMLVIGGASVYATFNLTGTGTVTVTAPIVSAVFVSGSVGGSDCTVTGQGAGLTCNSVSVQAGSSATLTFSVRNTGTIEVTLDITVTPVDAAVLSVTSANGSPDALAPGSVGTYVYVLNGLTTGNSGFTISVTPATLTSTVTNSTTSNSTTSTSS